MDIDGYKVYNCKAYDYEFVLIDRDGKVYVSESFMDDYGSYTIWKRGDELLLKEEGEDDAYAIEYEVEMLYEILSEETEHMENTVKAKKGEMGFLFSHNGSNIYMYRDLLVIIDGGKTYANIVYGSPDEIVNSIQDGIRPNVYPIKEFEIKGLLSMIKKNKKVMEALEPLMTSAILE